METELPKKLRVVTAICFEFCKNPKRLWLFLRTKVTQIEVTFYVNIIIFLIKINPMGEKKKKRKKGSDQQEPAHELALLVNIKKCPFLFQRHGWSQHEV